MPYHLKTEPPIGPVRMGVQAVTEEALLNEDTVETPSGDDPKVAEGGA